MEDRRVFSAYSSPEELRAVYERRMAAIAEASRIGRKRDREHAPREDMTKRQRLTRTVAVNTSGLVEQSQSQNTQSIPMQQIPYPIQQIQLPSRISQPQLEQVLEAPPVPKSRRKLPIPASAHFTGEPTNSGKGFLALPLAIRNRIYRYLLHAKEDIRLSQDWAEVAYSARTGIEPNVLGVCRQTLEEGCAVLYGENTFSYHLRDAPARQDVDELRILDDIRHINLGKYCRHLRGLEIIAEPQSTAPEHRDRMAQAIQNIARIPQVSFIDTLTIRLAPRKLVKETEVKVNHEVQLNVGGTLMVDEVTFESSYQPSFVDFFEPSQAVVPALLELRCKKLELVISRTQRFRSTIDLRFLPGNIAKLAPEDRNRLGDAEETAKVQLALATLNERIAQVADDEKRKDVNEKGASLWQGQEVNRKFKRANKRTTLLLKDCPSLQRIKARLAEAETQARKGR